PPPPPLPARPAQATAPLPRRHLDDQRDRDARALVERADLVAVLAEAGPDDADPRDDHLGLRADLGRVAGRAGPAEWPAPRASSWTGRRRVRRPRGRPGT